MLFTRHTLNLAKKLELKTKNLKADMFIEQIRQIWDNKIIVKLEIFFSNNLNECQSIAIIFA